MTQVPLLSNDGFNSQMSILAGLDEESSEKLIYNLFDNGILQNIPQAALIVHAAQESDDPQVLAGTAKVIAYAKAKTAPHIQLFLDLLKS